MAKNKFNKSLKDLSILKENIDMGKIDSGFTDNSEGINLNDTNMPDGNSNNDKFITAETENFYTKQGNISENRTAKAPYNFIPLNDRIVIAEKPPDNNKYHVGTKLTGYINVKIEARTPVFIRDSYTKKEKKEYDNINEKENKVPKDYEKLWEHSDFFSAGDGIPKIPGSSLRGMIRNMLEIISCGNFNDFEDKYLYYRDVGGRSVLGEDYRVEINQNTVKSGVLKKVGHKKYVILLSKPDNSGKSYYKIPIGLCRNYYSGKKIFFNANTLSSVNHYRVEWKVINTFVLQKDNEHPDTGYIVKTGPFRKDYEWVINADTSSILEVDYKNVIHKYIKDENRDKKNNYDVVGKADRFRDGTPCFFIMDGDKVKGIGHNPYFRMSYEKTIGEHIFTELKDKNYYDFSVAIFGNEKDFAGRVFFEDSVCKSELKDVSEGAANPKILSNPKPTCFQHYLTQDSDDITTLKHYNPIYGKLSAIRGYKLYWHKNDGYKWQENGRDVIESNLKQYNHKINPVIKGTVFEGRIRFENLSDVELGALLFSIDLPDNCCHKIGMAKPYGLGSVKITPELFISDRKKRYSDFEFELEETQKSDIKGYKEKFETYLLGILEEKKSSVWEIDRFKELYAMLDFKNIPDESSTEYMGLREFRERKVLPKPSQLKRKK